MSLTMSGHVHIHIPSDTLMYDKVHVAAADAVRSPEAQLCISRMASRKGLPAPEAANHLENVHGPQPYDLRGTASPGRF